MCVLVRRVQLCDPMECSHQAPLSMEFPRQEYWSGMPLPSPGDLPDPGIELRSTALETDGLPSEQPGKPCSLYLRPILQQPKGDPGRKGLFPVLHCSLGSLLLFMISYPLIECLFQSWLIYSHPSRCPVVAQQWGN